MTIDVPRLDGSLAPSGASGSFSEDFGRLVHEAPGAILRPGSVDDVVRVVAYARERGLPVAVNGQGGRDDQRESHSLHGQALVAGGIAVDAKSLAAIHRIDAGVAEVDAGVRWSSLVTAAATSGQTPPVVNDFPYLSVGGTLSVGGMGATSHRYGSQADNVLELEVVTGCAELVTCSPTRNRDLFDAVLAGGGQFGLIVRAVVRLVPIPGWVRMARVVYDDRATYMHDAVAMMQSGEVDDLAGAALPTPTGGWGYGLILATYSPSAPGSPDDAVLGHLSPGATLQEQRDMPYLDWLFRLDALWDQLQASGHWAQGKPRCTMFVAAEHADELADTILGELSPEDMGAGGARLAPTDAGAVKAPMFMLPNRTGPLFEISLGRFPAPDHPDIGGLLAQNRRFYDCAVALGGKRYLYGAIPDMSTEDWEHHYGGHWPVVRSAKARFDPDNVLTPGHRMFG